MALRLQGQPGQSQIERCGLSFMPEALLAAFEPAPAAQGLGQGGGESGTKVDTKGGTKGGTEGGTEGSTQGGTKGGVGAGSRAAGWLLPCGLTLAECARALDLPPALLTPRGSGPGGSLEEGPATGDTAMVSRQAPNGLDLASPALTAALGFAREVSFFLPLLFSSLYFAHPL